MDKTIALYMRLSDEDDNLAAHEESNSISNQKQLLMDYAVSHELPNPRHFWDDGISGTRFDRPAFLKMIEELQRHSEYGLIGPTMISSRGVVQMSARSFPTAVEKIFKAIPIKALQTKGEEMEIQKPNDPCAESYPVDYLMSACWLIRPEVLDKAGLLDENIFYAPEDAEYCIRVWKSGYQVAFCPAATIIHEWQRLSKKKLVSKMIHTLMHTHKYLTFLNYLQFLFEVDLL